MMEQKRLGDIATYINGFAFKPEDRSTVGLPIIRIQDLTGNAYDLGFYDGSYPKRIEINDGDVLISWSASLGVYVWNRGKALLNQHIFKVAFDKCDVNREFFVYAVRHKLKEMESKTHGATMKHIVKKDFDNTLIPFPTLNEQGKIAKLLDTAATIISARQQQLQKLDELVKARFVEMFGDIRTNNKELKTAKGSELFKFSSGKFLPEGKRKNAGIPVYGGNGIAWYTDEPLIDYPTIIVGRVGAQCGNIHFVNVPVWITDNAIYIKKQKTDLFTLEFLAEMMTVIDFSQFADFSGQPKITQKPLENTEYLIPTIEEQKAFSAFCKQVDKSKVAVQKALDEAQLLFDSLMQKYFG